MIIFSKIQFSKIKSFRSSNSLIKIIRGTVVDLPSPINISNFWNFGSCLGVCLIIQLVTGLFLASHYNSHPDLAFDSINHLIQDVRRGWLFRIIHLNGASFFFIFLFLHIARGLYYKSYNYLETWNLGVIIFIFSIAIAFLGYVLPWGQIRFWGATVITNLISAIPIVGIKIVNWIWGGFSVRTPTLSRFFMLHFCLPFILLALVILHIFFLHITGRQNPTNIKRKYNLISFHWFYSSKDLRYFFFWGLLLELLIFCFPFFLGDPENFILANSLSTPAHIVPEWYFLFAYAILRSIPRKLGGVIALLLSVIILFYPSLFKLILLNKNFITKINFLKVNIKKLNKRKRFNFFQQYIIWRFLTIFLILTWIGGEVVEEPFIIIGQIFLIFYFLNFFIITLL